MTARVDALKVRMHEVARVLRTIIGAPDYERYLEHMRTAHPGRVPISRDEFCQSRLQDRYSRPGNRCC